MAILEDIDIYGREDNNGSVIVHYGDDALKNAITFWMTSRKGDFVNEPEEGGPIDALAFKKIGEQNIEQITFSLENDIEEKFGGVLELEDIEITTHPTDYTILVIDIYYKSLITGNNETIQILTRTTPQDPPYELKEVTYTEENLYNWALLQINNLRGEKLIYNVELESWTWANFKLSNLTTADGYFSQLLTLINT